jgi:hypothetical protein
MEGLYLQLENEQAIYRGLIAQRRIDFIGQIVIGYSRKEILKIMEEIQNANKRQKTAKYSRARKALQYAREAMYRLRDIKNTVYCAISQVLEAVSRTGKEAAQ